ncbi:hypothetical protein DVR12_05910 [Chitinophaga silvatica]|uniref:Uncharacterized protein n=1 Tax=Chitinophaga silvatica TaxID=2282649 RepID=A0A3E1YDZ8_9BACT|nr:hypothetical protein [Chitinophaga silvatica]RFS24731.1 hypothetical protein DVR12_05910 [Chitinophaga silvatica]
MKYPILTLLVSIIWACNVKNPNKGVNSTPAILEAGETADCVFDTSSYKFTSEKLYSYKSDIKFFWDSTNQEAITVLNDTDSLSLHIGGCNHFGYYVTFSTDSSAYLNNEFLLRKSS